VCVCVCALNIHRRTFLFSRYLCIEHVKGVYDSALYKYKFIYLTTYLTYSKMTCSVSNGTLNPSYILTIGMTDVGSCVLKSRPCSEGGGVIWVCHGLHQL